MVSGCGTEKDRALAGFRKSDLEMRFRAKEANRLHKKLSAIERPPGSLRPGREQDSEPGKAARHRPRGAQGCLNPRTQGFDGDVLVVADGEVIEPKVIQRLLTTHQRLQTDATLATAARPPNSSAGILLKSARGNIVGILEAAKRQRLLALAKQEKVFKLRAEVERVVRETCGETTAKRLPADIWPAGVPNELMVPE
jgi:hypothetical protein